MITGPLISLDITPSAAVVTVEAAAVVATPSAPPAVSSGPTAAPVLAHNGLSMGLTTGAAGSRASAAPDRQHLISST